MAGEAFLGDAALEVVHLGVEHGLPIGVAAFAPGVVGHAFFNNAIGIGDGDDGA